MMIQFKSSMDAMLHSATCRRAGRHQCRHRSLQVKPQYLDGVLEALRPYILPNHLVISIAAGIKVSGLEAALPEGTRVVSQGAGSFQEFLRSCATSQLHALWTSGCLHARMLAQPGMSSGAPSLY